MRMASRIRRIGMLGLAMSLTAAWAGGCATQGSLDNSRATIRGLQQRVVELEQERDAALQSLQTAEGRARQAEQQASAASNRAMSAEQARMRDLNELKAENDRLASTLDQIDLMALPADLDRALSDLAMRHGNVMSYDAVTGMVRLQGDVTFELGSDAVRPDAANTLRSLAGIIANEPGFALRVVGHTDNVPVSKPETRAKHPTNMHLSVHRAISVRNTLVTAGLAPERISVGGYGEYRPIVANSTGGARENRRVEIYVEPYVAPVTGFATGGVGEAGSRQSEGTVTSVPEEPLK